jgi:hypothetical protein
MFFAERHTSESNFKIETSIVLEDKPTESVPEPASILGLVGVSAFGATSLKRKQRQNA